MKIQKENFGIAGEKIEKYQEDYRKKYNKKNSTISFSKVFKVGTMIQYRKHKSKNQRGRKTEIVWYPRDGHCLIKEINFASKKLSAFNPQTKEIIEGLSFDRIRLFHNTLKKSNYLLNKS